MLFAWRVVKHVKSNAIVYAKADRTRGIGAGQVANRWFPHCDLESGEAGLLLKAARSRVMLFFLFRTDVAAAEAGATCAIQPGGSVRDEEVIAAENERNRRPSHWRPALSALTHGVHN